MTIEPNRYNILKEHNYELKNEIDKQKNYNMSHAQRISELKKANEKLQDENEQLKQDLLLTEELQDEIIQLEKDFENRLKQELFNLYLKHYN